MNDPFIISDIILLFAFLIILIFNTIIFKSKIIKISFALYSVIFILLIMLFDNNFIYDFFKMIITYIWYPSYLLFVITIMFSIIIFLFTILNKNINLLNKILNYLIFVIGFSCYNIFKRFNIDPSIYSELYQSKSLIVMRIINISFLIWIIFNIILKIRGKYEK